jgi:hypothetical protein
MFNKLKRRIRFIQLQEWLSQYFRGLKNPAKEGDIEKVTYYRYEKRVFYNGEAYADLPDTFFHDFRVWQIVTTSLPNDYVLPNPESVRILMPMTADFYRSLFSSRSVNPELMVDDQIWKRIKAALPTHYKIPDPIFN